MMWQHLRRRCEQAVAEIEREVGLPDPYAMQRFMDALGARRGRAIELRPVDTEHAARVAGWRSYDDHDAIAYPAAASAAMQRELICHGLGHVQLGHGAQCVLALAGPSQAAPNLRPAALGHLLNRAEQAGEESAADHFARLLLARFRPAVVPPPFAGGEWRGTTALA